MENTIYRIQYSDGKAVHTYSFYSLERAVEFFKLHALNMVGYTKILAETGKSWIGEVGELFKESGRFESGCYKWVLWS